MRKVMTRVLPVPAPASTSKGPERVVTASRWGRLSSSRFTADYASAENQRERGGEHAEHAADERHDLSPFELVLSVSHQPLLGSLNGQVTEDGPDDAEAQADAKHGA